MSVILSLSQNARALWAAGPNGLFVVDGGELSSVLQPQQFLYVTCAIHDRVMVGGAPYGVAYSLNNGESWQASWMDRIDAPVVTLAPAPDVEMTGAILAGTEGGGVLRTANRGESWYSCNYGLHSLNVLHLAWAPTAPALAWPRWRTVYACTDEGIYHSPNGGRGWKRCTLQGVDEAVFQMVAPALNFHTSGLVLAGTESSGLWRSMDGGHTFALLPETPEQINALLVLPDGSWLLSDEAQLWSSPDGERWTPLSDSRPALTLFNGADGVWAGYDDGTERIVLHELVTA